MLKDPNRQAPGATAKSAKKSLSVIGQTCTPCCRIRSGASECARPFSLLPISPLDRHRGGGHPPTPATPPCVRVRTRRFELVTLAAIDQRWKSERLEVSIGKPHREGFGPGQIPGAESAASRVLGQSRANPQC